MCMCKQQLIHPVDFTDRFLFFFFANLLREIIRHISCLIRESLWGPKGLIKHAEELEEM